MPYISSTDLALWMQERFGGLPYGIIFDCDGVVIDSREANISYYNYLREFLGLPKLSAEQEVFVQMATVHQALDAIIPKPLQPLLREATQRVSYKRDIMPRITHYPHLHDVLDLCREHRVRLGMNTNRVDGMDMLLTNCRLHGYFDPIVLASHVRRPKPDPEGALMIASTWECPPEKLLFLGDSASDKGAAEAAGMAFLSFQNEKLDKRVLEDFSVMAETIRILTS